MENVTNIKTKSRVGESGCVNDGPLASALRRHIEEYYKNTPEELYNASEIYAVCKEGTSERK